MSNKFAAGLIAATHSRKAMTTKKPESIEEIFSTGWKQNVFLASFSPISVSLQSTKFSVPDFMNTLTGCRGA